MYSPIILWGYTCEKLNFWISLFALIVASIKNKTQKEARDF